MRTAKAAASGRPSGLGEDENGKDGDRSRRTDRDGSREERGEPGRAPLGRIGDGIQHRADEVVWRLDAGASPEVVADLVVAHDATSGSDAASSGPIAARSAASPELRRDLAVPTRTSSASAVSAIE